MPKNDGGPAFPDPVPREDGWPGMSLRQFYAGLIAANLTPLAITNDVDDYTPRHIASDAVSIADALIAELEAQR